MGHDDMGAMQGVIVAIEGAIGRGVVLVEMVYMPLYGMDGQRVLSLERLGPRVSP